jgi:hypothetical protein
MPKTLSIDTIARSAQIQLELTDKAKDLQEMVDIVYPGFKVRIVMDDGEADEPTTKTKYENAIAAAKGVLTISATAMSKDDLLSAVNALGFPISKETLSGYLSKDEDFVRDENHRGVWGLKKHFQTKP